jgi:hypothetical protein
MTTEQFQKYVDERKLREHLWNMVKKEKDPRLFMLRARELESQHQEIFSDSFYDYNEQVAQRTFEMIVDIWEKTCKENR